MLDRRVIGVARAARLWIESRRASEEKIILFLIKYEYES